MNWEQPKVYAVQHRNDSVRAESRSGGIFTALSDYILENEGVIYGCVLDENFNAIHIRADEIENRNRMRGSKYIQSKLGDTYKNVKNDLIAGRNVLFSGTSCQVAGLKQYLGKEYENLLCVDIVCHGVPSPKVWKAYLKWQESKTGATVIAVDFRNKKAYGWRDHVETLELNDGNSVASKIFTKLFYGHAVLRPSCYECPYKSIMHPGDITIADYWGIEKAVPNFDDNKGSSLVLVNNDKGMLVFESSKDRVKWQETRIEDSLQPPLKEPFPKPDFREQFWKDFSRKGFHYIARKYGKDSLTIRAKYKIKGIINKLLCKLK